MKRIELFKTGKHTDANGTTRIFTADDLNQIAQSFDADKVRIAVSHADKSPVNTYGTINKVYVRGNTLLADINFKAFFEGILKTKEIGARSIGIIKTTGNWVLDHIAFLGKTQPALDLKPIYNQEPGTCLVFSCSFMEETTMDTNQEAEFAKQQATHLVAQANFEKEKAEFQVEKTALKTDQATLAMAQAQLTTAQSEFAKAQHGQFLDKLIDSGKLLEKDKEATLGLMAGMNKDSLTIYQKQLSKAVAVVDTSTIGGNVDAGDEAKFGKAPDGVDEATFMLDKKIKAYMDKNPKVSYRQALLAVNTGDK